jgi:hypothetical protein
MSTQATPDSEVELLNVAGARAESGASGSDPQGNESCFERLSAEFVAVDVTGQRLNAGRRRVREDRERRQALHAGTQTAA